MRCPSCSKEVQPGALRCRFCGARGGELAVTLDGAVVGLAHVRAAIASVAPEYLRWRDGGRRGARPHVPHRRAVAVLLWAARALTAALRR